MFRNLIERYVASRTPPVSREKIEKEVEAKRAETGIIIAGRFTRGNVSIQSQDMISEEDRGPPGASLPKLRKAAK